MVGITVITLLTDLGESEYPAMMKGVILNIAPDVQIVDNTHSILPQNILEGAFILEYEAHPDAVLPPMVACLDNIKKTLKRTKRWKRYSGNL